MRSVSIPRTKLHPPALRQPIVPRPRLTESFHAGHMLTIISAPAGSGKTTLALEWVTANDDRVAWYSLDTEDNDPIRFVHGFIEALQVAGTKLRIRSNQRNLQSIFTDLINQLEDSESITLVLDDYHVISNESIHTALAYFLDHLPPSFHMLLVTRESPSLPLARLRARRLLHEIDLSDLRFTTEETNSFLNEVMGLDLSAEQIHSLERYTQGWIAGLQMAGISLQSNKSQNVTTTSERKFITEYLLSEILTQQPKDVQDFLLNTSIFESFSLALCKEVVSKHTGRLLTRVQRANLFITTIGSWHQYHLLFREFLQTRLQNENPERMEGLHRKAISWFEQNGFPEAALQHAHAIADLETYARLVELLAPEYLKRGELVTLRRWLDRLPDSIIWNHPRLCLTQIWLLLDSNLQIDAQSYFDRLGTFLEQNLQGEFLAVRALHAAMTHQPEIALKFAKRAQESPQSKDPFIQTYVSFGMGAAQKMGLNFFQAEQSFRDSLSHADADENAYMAIASLVNLADVLYLQARLHDAENICKQALKRFGDLPDSRDWHWTLARVSFQHNDMDQALQHIEHAVERSAESQEIVVHSRALLQRALIHHAMNEKRLAQADLDAADHLARGLQDQVILRSAIRQRVLFAAQAGELENARKWLSTLMEYGEQPFPFYLSYATGRVRFAEGKFKEAESEFESALNSLQDADFILVRIEVMVWQAACLGALGRTTDGVNVLKHAIKASQTENIIRPFIEAKESLLKLIEKTGRDGVDWVLETLGENGKPAEGPTLTRREREILQLLAVGLSNQEMAERLVIAEGTLKRHIANLYQKLGVHNRTQAIRHFNGQ
jgi:LuxR family maltose regulon positive regulatory protein